MIVCLCRRVSDRDIVSAARDGCASFEELQSRLGVATCCGNCGECARNVFHRRTSVVAVDAAGHAAAYAAAAVGAPLG